MMATRKHTWSTKPIDITGQRFGRLLVMSLTRDEKGRRAWICRCDCGKDFLTYAGRLKHGNPRSCGCGVILATIARSTSHGQSRRGQKTPEYRAWRNMVNRCHDEANAAYHNYGGRGILVCERWRHDYAAFFADMGPKPSSKHTIDRTDNSKGYEPDNCRWATRKQQMRNFRGNRLIEHNGETRCVSEWAERYRLPFKALCRRLDRGWSVLDVLTKPLRITSLSP